MIRSKLERPKKPLEVLSRLVFVVNDYELQFDHVLTEVEQLLSLTKSVRDALLECPLVFESCVCYACVPSGLVGILSC